MLLEYVGSRENTFNILASCCGRAGRQRSGLAGWLDGWMVEAWRDGGWLLKRRFLGHYKGMGVTLKVVACFRGYFKGSETRARAVE